MAKIGVEDQVYTDPRYKFLGQKLGSNKFEAWGRMLPIWNHCTENNTTLLRKEVIDALAELDGFTDFLCDPLIHLAEKKEDGTYLVVGAEGRIEWLAKLRDNGKFGHLGGRPKGKTQKGSKKKPTRVSGKNPQGSKNKTPSVSVFVSVSDIVSVQKENIKEIFEFFLGQYKSKFEVPTTGAYALARFTEQITDLQAVKDLDKALTNYRTFLDWEENNYRQPKQSFATFLGTKASSYFWRDFIKLPKRSRPGNTKQPVNWEREATILLFKVDEVSPQDPSATEKIRELVGEERYQLMARIGGVPRIRSFKDGSQRTIKTLADELKCASETLEKEGMGTAGGLL